MRHYRVNSDKHAALSRWSKPVSMKSLGVVADLADAGAFSPAALAILNEVKNLNVRVNFNGEILRYRSG